MLRRIVKVSKKSEDKTLKKEVSQNEKKTVLKKRSNASEYLGGERKRFIHEKNVLENLVFGGEEELTKSLSNVTSQNRKEKKKEKSAVWEDEDDVTCKVESTKIKHPFKKKHGEHVTELSGGDYKKALQAEFEKVSGTPSWAKLDTKPEDDEDEDDDVLQTTGNYLATSSSLPSSVIQLKKLDDVNNEAPSTGKLTSVEFHPSAQVALTAGFDHILNLFQVDGKTNPKIQNVFMEKFPIFKAHFTMDGTQVTLASRMRSFYYYDMMSAKCVNVPKIKGLNENYLTYHEISPDGKFIVFRGSYGYIHLISSKSKELIQSLKMNGTVNDLAFTKDGSTMYSFGDDGDVYVWDMDRRACVHKFADEGCVKGLSLAVSPNNQYIACGSYSGVVNVYDLEGLTQRYPKPQKAFMNLTSPCTDLQFNSTSELLAMASKYAEHAVKMAHFPSKTVFSNFPNRTTDSIRIPLSMDFSLNSGYFTVSNQKGKALLYRVKHYENY